jgi:predicted pyridoxine 5'-phosphate oxidase superfamily flavin-nucleotide-binding protein
MRKKRGIFCSFGDITMVSIPKDVQEFLPGKLAWVATASRDGVPNATPKGSLKLLDDEHVVFADLFSQKTRKNLAENPKVAVTVIDAGTGKGYQIKGVAEIVSSGSLFDATSQQLKASPKDLPPLRYVVKIAVDAVFDQSVGLEAGKQIA